MTRPGQKTAPEPGPKSRANSRQGPTLAHRLQDLLFRGLLALLMALPYERRIPLMGWVMARLIAPLAGYNRRIRANLAHVHPDMPEAEIRALCRAVPDNLGRTVAEIYSGREFTDRIARVTPTGPGLAALDAARAEGRPVILVSGHFGNYDAFRAAIAQRVGEVGALYRPMNNPLFNAHYVRAMCGIAEPMFARGRRGLAEMVKHLRQGNVVALLSDQHMGRGTLLDFLGRPAPSALSAAEMALKYNAVLIPVYGIRQPDGLGFRVELEAPIPQSDAVTMMQAAADSLAARIEKHPGQWLWIHRRWKPERRKLKS
jgi:Kdo2-lipid IVA lauroyltransferase/acyltransferase